MIAKIFNKLFSTTAAGCYIIIFAISIGFATFIENDYGTSAAQKNVFKTFWFELLLGLFAISLVVNIIKFRLIQQKKWAVFTFHLAIIVILLGSAVTRYFGSEGMMFIRQNQESNSFLSSETYLQIQFKDPKDAITTFVEPVLFSSLGKNNFKKSYSVNQQDLDIELTHFTPNPIETIEKTTEGKPVLTAVFGGEMGREEFQIEQFDKDPIYGTVFNFDNPEDKNAFNIKLENGNLFFKSSKTVTQMVMATQTNDTLQANIYHPLKLKSLYSDGTSSFVFSQFYPTATIKMSSKSLKMNSSSLAALEFNVNLNNEIKNTTIFGSQGFEGEKKELKFANQQSCSISYGAKKTMLPFAIKLKKFIVERYPGTNNASSYESDVSIIDSKKETHFDYQIYMNHVLDYDGYRFFQTSFDKDESGTQLSVNHDFWGTWISYFGYILLTIGMVLTLFTKSSRFRQLAQKSSKKGVSKNLIVLLLVAFHFSNAFAQDRTMPEIDLEHANKFRTLLMQDQQGRVKPMNTFANEVVRKLSRKESLFGQTPEQIILGMMSDPNDWYYAKIIKIGTHEAIANMLNVTDETVSYFDFFNEKGEYKLMNAVIKATETPARERGVLDKEIIKIDEKVNICEMIFAAQFLRIFPNTDDKSKSWLSPSPQLEDGTFTLKPNLADQFFKQYNATLQAKNWNVADQIVDKAIRLQLQNGSEMLPTSNQIKAELLYNKLNIFGKLTTAYGLLSLGFLVLLFVSVFKPNFKMQLASKIAVVLFMGCFLAHTFALGLRWYIAGRAPWSNGYESMIYIGFTTVLAGLILARKSLGGLAATALLASTLMMVAGLSYLDPEITPLVPVLKSYWLTIHVSLEAGSYGFLVLGAIIGVLNLIFMTLKNKTNKENTNRIIKELSDISEMTLIIGLFMISIGTYLGGVWANESWGRYWGWDAKETWALVTILVYSFILHMRFIPGMRGLYAFNVATLFGWGTVAMTYFGVNYYLSGLHSYATGDPVPVPIFVYIILAVLLLISVLAKRKEKI